MTTPEEAVRVARDEVERNWSAAERYCGGDPSLFVPRILNTYRDALLTAERARLAARVEALARLGMVSRSGYSEDAEMGPAPHGEYLDRAAVLALLREPA